MVLFNGTGSQIDLSYYALDLDGITTDLNGLALIGNTLVHQFLLRLLPIVLSKWSRRCGYLSQQHTDFPAGTAATTTNLIDALVYETGDATACFITATFGLTAQIDENLNNLQTTQSIQKKK